MNTGALCPEDYGEYYTFANKASELTTGWRVPTIDELLALKSVDTNAWTTQNGVTGCKLTIGSNTLFLPAAGRDDGDNNPSDFIGVSTDGYYWSSIECEGQDKNLLAFCLNFDKSAYQSQSNYKVDALTIRPFHDL